MEKRKNRRKLNNKGFSFAELIVAIAILSIVALPVLSSLITSMRINMKAKERQRLNAAAQSIMEGFKAYSLEDLISQFNGGELRIYNNSATVTDGTIPTVDGWSLVSDDTKSWSFTDDSDPLHVVTNHYEVPTGTFKLENLKYQGGEYDAKVVVDLKTDANESGAVIYDGTREIRYIEDMNGYQDCVYIQQIDDLTSNYYSLLTLIAGKLNELDQVYGYTEDDDPTRGYHVTNLDMSKIAISRDTKVMINTSTAVIQISYKAEVNNYPYYGGDGEIHLFPAGGEDGTFALSKVDTFYDNTLTGAPFKNVFLFIYPAYSSVLSGYPFVNDTYDISNTDTEKKNVFFVKQINSTIANLETCENAYTPDITFSNINLYHNLADNLAGGSTVGSATFRAMGNADIVDGISINKGQALVYKVDIYLYAAGDYDGVELYHLEGTKNNH